ncbi:MAG: SDR family NAD(P)-dependent oxidoreductase, partial [Vulcanimicrobiota bacterium]
ADLTVPRETEEMIQTIYERFGEIDVLINVVGPFFRRNILDISPAQFKEVIELNLMTAYNTTHYSLNKIRKPGGHIIYFGFAGVENIKDWSNSPGFCIAKTGILVLAKSLAATLAADKIRVNCVCPGIIKQQKETADRKEVAEKVPWGRYGSPVEIAETVSWLVRESPDYITGSSVNVSGAWEY